MSNRGPETASRWEVILSGALEGIAIWTTYGIVECWFVAALPRLVHSTTYVPPHWGFSAMLFAFYPLLGAVMGGLSAWLIGAVAPGGLGFTEQRLTIRVQTLVTFILLSAYSINFVSNWSVKSPFVLISLLLCFGLVVVLALRASSVRWASRLAFVSNPWTVCLLLLGLPWLTLEVAASNSRVAVAAVAVTYTVGTVVASMLVAKALSRSGLSASRDARSTPTYGYVAALFVASTLTLYGTSFLRQRPLVIGEAPVAVAPDPASPHILLITMDTVRADHLPLYGYERNTTPNLARLAEEATLYTRAVAPGDMTLSTHASLFTGLYTSWHGAYYSDDHPAGRPLSESFRTLAECLSERGYMGGAVVANHGFLSDAFRLNQGFHYYDSRVPVHFFSAVDDFYIRQGIRNLLTRLSVPWKFDLLTRRAEQINEEVFALLDMARTGSRPYFLFINYMDAHWPYIPPPPYDDRYPGKDGNFDRSHYFRRGEEVLKGERRITEREESHLLSQYDGAIAYLDSHIGNLLAKMKDLGLYDKTMIIITSDHGEVFGERDLMEHGVSVYQDQVHVPLIVKLPGSRESAVVRDVVSLADVLPTVLDVLNYEIPEIVQGRSLLDSTADLSRLVISESFPRATLVRWNPRFDRVERALFWESYKLVRDTAGKRELYDLARDPFERNDIHAMHEDISKQLYETLDSYLRTASEHVDPPSQLDKETLERLRSLGYLQ